MEKAAEHFQQSMQQNVVVPEDHQPPQQQQQPVVVLLPTQVQPTAESYAHYNRKYAKVFGITQIFTSLTLFCLNVGMAINNYNFMWVTGSGWWTAPFIIIAGGFGMASSSRPTNCTVISTMVFAILSCVLSVTIVTQGSVSLAMGCEVDCDDDDDDDEDDHDDDCGGKAAHLALSGFYTLFGIFEFFLSMAQSVVCCRGSCCKPAPQVNHAAATQNNYGNNGFVPFYINPQTSSWSALSQPPGGPTGQNVTMATGQVDGATGEPYDDQPPPYSKVAEAGLG